MHFMEFAKMVEDQAAVSLAKDRTYGDIPDDFKGQLPTNFGVFLLIISLLGHHDGIHCTPWTALQIKRRMKRFLKIDFQKVAN